MSDNESPDEGEQPNPLMGMVAVGDADIVRGGQVVTDDEEKGDD